MKNVRLTGSRVVIREWKDGDATAIMEYAADPAVVQFMPWGPSDPEDIAAFLLMVEAERSANPRMKFEMAVTLLHGEVIGGGGIRIIHPEDAQGEIGYVLRRDVWG